MLSISPSQAASICSSVLPSAFDVIVTCSAIEWNPTVGVTVPAITPARSSKSFFESLRFFERRLDLGFRLGVEDGELLA